jgi:patatin-like phospholipase/acyl hydrolase
MSYSCRILAIDGGGIRGVIPAYILQQLEAALGKPIYQCFDVIAGTSTGGLIALALTTPTASGQEPLTASDVLNLYLNDEDDIFVYQSSGDFMDSKYYGTDTATTPPSGIQPWLQNILGSSLTLSQAQQQLASLGNPIPSQVLTTCYTINGAQGVAYAPYLFNWVDAVKAPNGPDDYYVWEAARCTSAAPTYFPVANVGNGAPGGSQATNRWAADGGVTANNPALYALAAGFALGLCSNLSDVLIVSLDTGLYGAGIKITSSGNWGLMEWSAGMDTNGYDTAPLINVLSGASH